jgi:1-deoxy-D-xylulose 5-phosphate reductoisomerase
MKIILLGSTGFIGKDVLDQCLKNPTITSIIALSRRDLPREVANPKLTVVLIKDFKLYPESVLEQLKGAKACIW